MNINRIGFANISFLYGSRYKNDQREHEKGGDCIEIFDCDK